MLPLILTRAGQRRLSKVIWTMSSFKDGETEDRDGCLLPKSGSCSGAEQAPALGSLITQLFHGMCGQWGLGGQGNRESQCHLSPARGGGGAPWPASVPGPVSVYSTGPQGLASLSSKSWPVRHPPWLWSRFEDFQVSVVLKFLQSLSRRAQAAVPARAPHVPFVCP